MLFNEVELTPSEGGAKKLSRDDFARFVPKAKVFREALELLNSLPGQTSSSLVSLLALHTVHDLFDAASSDEANLKRVCHGLDVALSELESIRSQLQRCLKSRGSAAKIDKT